jgi:hypothetical protein
MANLKLEQGHESIKIYLNDVLHLAFKRCDFKGLQAYINCENGNPTYCIDLRIDNDDINCEYEDKDLWKELLILISRDIFQ